MTKELINNYRKIVLPYVARELSKVDYERQGKEDAKEFIEHSNEILDLATKALEQPCRDMEEIREVMGCDADAETKCKMISNILTTKSHYFEKQGSCGDDTTFKENVLDAISRIGLQKSDTKEVQVVAECLKAVEDLSPVKPESCDKAINRQMVLNALRRHYHRGYRDVDGDWVDGSYHESVYDEINELPPVTPQSCDDV